MRLPQPPRGYSALSEMQRNGIIERADGENHKRGRDVEVGQARLILTSPDGNRWSVAVDNSGNLTATAL